MHNKFHDIPNPSKLEKSRPKKIIIKKIKKFFCNRMTKKPYKILKTRASAEEAQ